MKDAKTIQVTDDVELVFLEVRDINLAIKELEKRKKMLVDKLNDVVGEYESFKDSEGLELATWKYSSPSKYFDSKAFEQSHPNLYKKFIKMRDGSRRLIFK